MKAILFILLTLHLNAQRYDYQLEQSSWANAGTLCVSKGRYTVDIDGDKLYYTTQGNSIDVTRIGDITKKEESIYTNKFGNYKFVTYIVDFKNYKDPTLDIYTFVVHDWKTVIINPAGIATILTNDPSRVINDWK